LNLSQLAFQGPGEITPLPTHSPVSIIKERVTCMTLPPSFHPTVIMSIALPEGALFPFLEAFSLGVLCDLWWTPPFGSLFFIPDETETKKTTNSFFCPSREKSSSRFYKGILTSFLFCRLDGCSPAPLTATVGSPFSRR